MEAVEYTHTSHNETIHEFRDSHDQLLTDIVVISLPSSAA